MMEPGFIYCSELGFYGVKEMETSAKGITTAIVTNGVSLEKWLFRQECSTLIGNTLYVSEKPQRTEWKGKRK